MIQNENSIVWLSFFKWVGNKGSIKISKQGTVIVNSFVNWTCKSNEEQVVRRCNHTFMFEFWAEVWVSPYFSQPVHLCLVIMWHFVHHKWWLLWLTFRRRTRFPGILAQRDRSREHSIKGIHREKQTENLQWLPIPMYNLNGEQNVWMCLMSRNHKSTMLLWLS